MKINIWNVSYKITKVILVLIISFIGLFWFGLIYSDKTGRQDAERESLEQVITSNIRLLDGYSELYRTSKSLINKDEWFDLEPISVEEWKDVKCEFTRKNEHGDFTYQNYYGNRSDFTQQARRRNYCISSDIRINDYTTLPENYKDYLNKQSFSEGGWYSPCLRVSFHEYIIQYPKILRNILKIAEKPCNYLKNMRGENCYRSALSCDSFGKWPSRNERTCVIINIISSAGELRSQIVVPRKDNNNLFKKNR